MLGNFIEFSFTRANHVSIGKAFLVTNSMDQGSSAICRTIPYLNGCTQCVTNTMVVFRMVDIRWFIWATLPLTLKTTAARAASNPAVVSNIWWIQKMSIFITTGEVGKSPITRIAWIESVLNMIRVFWNTKQD